MKKILIAVVAIWCFMAKAQAQTFTYVADSLFLHLDKSVISTGILYDRVLPVSSLHELNKNEPDTTWNSYFSQAYLEMFHAAYDQSTWFSVDTIASRATPYILNGQVPVALAFYRYNVIDTNALQNNLIQMHSDSLYYDTPGRTTSPYNTLNTFVATALVDSVNADGGITFTFPSSLFINKSPLSIASLQVDFNDGRGLVNVSLNSTYFVSYGAPDGYRYLKFVATMSDNSTYTTYTQLKIYNTTSSLMYMSAATPNTTADATGSCISPVTGLWSTGTFKGPDESAATPGYGEFQIYYATNGTCDGVIRKPIIVLDGFDAKDSRTIDKIYRTINHTTTFSSLNYADYLRSIGYDIIILNFPEYNVPGTNRVRDGGVDYIERNALILESLFDYISANKQGTERSILLGPSMGGLISRYALRDYEIHNLTHNVKLWISFDAPHLGANVPVGDQFFLDYFASEDKTSKDERDNVINSPAAKEMLINHYLNADFTLPGVPGTISPGGAPGYRNNFVSTLNSMGFPVGDAGQPFRKIAVVDGSLGGNQIYSAACGQGFYMDTHAEETINLWLFKVRIKSIALATAQVKFTPDGGNACDVFSGTSVLKFTKKEFFTTANGTTSYDLAPGGTFDVQNQIAQKANGKPVHFLDFKNYFSGVLGSHSFISTKSALAFTGSNQNLSEDVSTRNLVCTGETPFNSYFGSFNTNSQHMTLTTDMENWLLQEILGNPQLPSVMNTTYTINGPASICGPTSYSVANLPSSAAVTWAANPSTAVSLSPSGQSVVATTDQGGSFTLSATITNGCQPGTASLNVQQTALPTPTISAFLKNVAGGTSTIVFSVPSVSGVTYQWTINGQVKGVSSNTCSITAPSCSGGAITTTYSVVMTETGSCSSATGCRNYSFSCSPSPTLTDNGICSDGGLL